MAHLERRRTVREATVRRLPDDVHLVAGGGELLFELLWDAGAERGSLIEDVDSAAVGLCLPEVVGEFGRLLVGLRGERLGDRVQVVAGVRERGVDSPGTSAPASSSTVAVRPRPS